ncbi:MAG: hypothetical protein QF437_07685, partial [Planctomycetota bacterium]|nr:hypothetical protein [Planctomycetota bacterium]
MNVSVVSSILTVAFILAPDGRSESPFPNSDFEMETFTNWPVHDGWQLHGGLKTLSGLPHQRLADQTDGDLVGFHSASSYDLREGLATFYTGKKIGAYPKRLASDPFRVTQPFLAFLMTGSLESGKNFIGMDFNADGKPDVSLEDATWRMVRKQCRHAALFCVDLRDHLGRTGTFVANVESGWLSVDRLSLESAPPLMIQSLKVTQTGRQAKAAIKVINPWSVESNGTLAVEVLDFYGKKIAEEGFEVRELGKDDPGSQNVGHTFHFSVGHGPDFRIRARLFSDSGTLLSVFHHRWTAERLSQDRPKVLIDDGWKVSVSDDAKIELPLPDAAWSAESPIMPSGSFGYRSHRWKKYQNRAQVWYRREFEFPSRTLPLKRTILNLQGGGDGLFSVFVNGKEIATRSIYRYNNYSFDLSATVTSGSNELVIRFRNPDRYLRGPDKAYIVPVREYWGVPMGLFGHAWLVSRPEVFADQILIDPSLEKKRLTLRASILNAGPHQARATVSASVFDPEGREVLKFREQNLEAGTDEPIDLEMVKRWRRPILWSLESPRLLRLRLTVTANGQTDVTDTRFGFREISIKGRDVLLNGAHLTIFDGTMPVSENFRFLKRVFGQNATRTPWVSYDSVLISDEEGILTRMVNGNIPIPKKADIRKRYWQKVTELQLSKTRYLYNNPSVWMWVVGNELGGAGYLRKPLLETFRPLYTNLIKDIQLLDPMRPVTSDGDLDFWGTSKLLNAHYPHEYGRSFGLPNLAYFSDRGTQLMDWFPHPPYDGEKPIFLGEAFSGGNMGPDWLAPFGGDRVYSPTGLLDTWREWTLLRMRAYRDQRFVGFEPFEPFASVRDFLPVDVYPKNYGTAFFGGQKLKRKIKVFNAVLSPRKFKLHWGLEGIDEGTKSLKLAPGGDKEIELSVSLPEVNARTDAVFRLQITEDGEPIPRGGRWSGLYSIFPKRKLERQVAVSSTSSNLIGMLKSLGIEAIQVSKVSELGKHRFLVTSGEIFHTDREQAFSWIRRGGRALILGQKEDIEELPLRLNRFSNTRSHLIAPSHPIMKGLSPSDFSYWGDDHWIAHSSYSKPLDGSFQVLCETGDELGLGLTPLVEVDEGRGSILYCSLLVAEKLAQQPVAARLLENILMWGALPLRPELKAGAILSDAVTAKLRRDGWDIDDLTVQPSPEISDYTLLWVDAGLSEVDQTQLKGWIQKGGTLVLSRMDPTVFEKWKELIPFSFRLQTSPRDIRYGGELQRNQSCALFEGI